MLQRLDAKRLYAPGRVVRVAAAVYKGGCPFCTLLQASWPWGLITCKRQCVSCYPQVEPSDTCQDQRHSACLLVLLLMLFVIA